MDQWLMRLMSSPELVKKLQPETRKKLEDVQAKKAQIMAIQAPKEVDTDTGFSSSMKAVATAQENNKKKQHQKDADKKAGKKEEPSFMDKIGSFFSDVKSNAGIKTQPDESQVTKLQVRGALDNENLVSQEQQRNFARDLEKMKKMKRGV